MLFLRLFRETFESGSGIIGSVQFFHGFIVGLALVMPIGPVALTLIGVGVERGRRAGLAGALGVVLADALLVGTTVLAADRVARLGTSWIRPTEIVLGVLVGVVGIVALTRSQTTRTLLGRVQRPTPTLLALTLSNPLSLALWAGVVLTLPASMLETVPFVTFGAGIVAASAVWHTGLGVAASWLGRRMSARAKNWSPRVAGVTMLVVAGMLVM